MDTTSQKWLLGCGAGCAVVLVLIVVFVAGAFMLVRDRIRPLQNASASRKEIVAEYGSADSYVPPPDGAISRERMEVFLSVRESLKDAQDSMDKSLNSVDFGRMTKKKQSFGEVLQTLSDVSNLIIPIGEYADRRNRVLLDKHMGLGEYAYIYSIAYHSWLGHSPDEGPPIFGKLARRKEDHFQGPNASFSPELVRWKYRQLMMRFLENQLGGVKDAGGENWHNTLKRELDRLERGADRVAWQDNLPLPIEQCLEPYRSRLESTYRTASNCFELLTLDESRQIEFHRPSEENEAERGAESGQVELPPEPAIRGSAGKASGAGVRGDSEVSYTVGSGVTAPLLLAKPLPAYTDEARRAHVEGVVTIQAVVRKDGSIGSPRIVRKLGYGLDESALNTVVRAWKFKPAQLDSRPIDVPATIEIIYRLP